MPKIRIMRNEDVETVARMVALDHDIDPEKGYNKALEHTIEHLKIVPQHCYIVEDDEGEVTAVMVLHPQEEIFEIEDFHVENIQHNKEVLKLLKKKLMEYLETVKTEVLCCPYAMKRLI